MSKRKEPETVSRKRSAQLPKLPQFERKVPVPRMIRVPHTSGEPFWARA
jgi:hypothetical protein